MKVRFLEGMQKTVVKKGIKPVLERRGGAHRVAVVNHNREVPCVWHHTLPVGPVPLFLLDMQRWNGEGVLCQQGTQFGTNCGTLQRCAARGRYPAPRVDGQRV